MEINELTRSLVRVEDLIKGGENAGALNCLWISQNHALSATKLISDQSKVMTEQALKIKELTERLGYWQKRAESAEAEIKGLDDQDVFKWERTDKNFSTTDPEVAFRWINQGLPTIELYARRVPAKSVPDGFALVPIEPTTAMLDAGVAMALQVSVSGEGGWSKYLSGLWQQMLSAAKGE